MLVHVRVSEQGPRGNCKGRVAASGAAHLVPRHLHIAVGSDQHVSRDVGLEELLLQARGAQVEVPDRPGPEAVSPKLGEHQSSRGIVVSDALAKLELPDVLDLV